MKNQSMNQALAATARIACLVALVGCRNSGELYTADPDSGATDSGPTDSGGVELDTAEEEPECSVDWAVANYSEDQDNSMLEPCCELLLDQVGYIGECCIVVGWDNPACMAWGPPRPPAVGRKIRAAQGAQRVGLAARSGVAAAVAA